MSSKARGCLITLVVVVVAGCVLLAAVGYALPRGSFPQINGEVRVDGLDSPVDIYRDSFGIPHIYAKTSHDLFFAQGYVHAQDRFWQMDFWRHIGSARLSEMFGESMLDLDTFLRTMGWARVVEQEIEGISPEDLAPLQAYADGVNAYLADHQGSALSLEYTILPLINPDYEPEPWEPLHSLTWAKAMAWDLSGNLSFEIRYASMLNDLTLEQVVEIIPPYPDDHPVIVPNFTLGESVAGVQGVGSNQGLLDTQVYPLLSPAFESVAEQVDGLEMVLGPTGDWVGSNDWVIAGELTETGMPILADDMHLGVEIPAIWYEVGLHCTSKGPDCPYDVIGFSFAGVPGVIVGHNDRVAWGFTNVGPDVIDLYIEKVNPANPIQYEVNGEWVDMQIVEETIEVAGGDPVELTVRYTRHGPVISEVYAPLENFSEDTRIDLPENYVLTMRWTALEPSYILGAIIGFNRAQNWEEFRQAASHFAVPSQNIVYADIDGNIAYQTPGRIPIRNDGHDGRLPVPGWTDDYEWQGYIPFAELPYTFNPPEGYVATANNAVVDETYPYMISKNWAYGYRARRIVDMIEGAPAPITVEYVRDIHGDNKDLNAVTLVPILMGIPLDDARLEDAWALLEDWDYQNHMDMAAPALFNTFWKQLLAVTFRDDLPERFWPGGGGHWFEVVRNLVEEPDSHWWDDKNTPEIETRDDMFYIALVAAVDDLEGILGEDMGKWKWGDMHTVTFQNQSLGTVGNPLMDMLFNRGPYNTSGGSAMVNNTAWSAKNDDANEAYHVLGLPSERMIVDMSDLSGSISVITTGQSGHAFHRHYTDMIDLWRNIEYHPMLWDRAQIEADKEGYLRLEP
jgi:penicillin amidase